MYVMAFLNAYFIYQIMIMSMYVVSGYTPNYNMYLRPINKIQIMVFQNFKKKSEFMTS